MILNTDFPFCLWHSIFAWKPLIYVSYETDRSFALSRPIVYPFSSTKKIWFLAGPSNISIVKPIGGPWSLAFYEASRLTPVIFSSVNPIWNSIPFLISIEFFIMRNVPVVLPRSEIQNDPFKYLISQCFRLTKLSGIIILFEPECLPIVAPLVPKMNKLLYNWPSTAFRTTTLFSSFISSACYSIPPC